MSRFVFWMMALAVAWLLLRDEPAFISLLDRIAWGWELFVIAFEELK